MVALSKISADSGASPRPLGAAPLTSAPAGPPRDAVLGRNPPDVVWLPPSLPRSLGYFVAARDGRSNLVHDRDDFRSASERQVEIR